MKIQIKERKTDSPKAILDFHLVWEIENPEEESTLLLYDKDTDTFNGFNGSSTLALSEWIINLIEENSYGSLVSFFDIMYRDSLEDPKVELDVEYIEGE